MHSNLVKMERQPRTEKNRDYHRKIRKIGVKNSKTEHTRSDSSKVRKIWVNTLTLC